MDEHKFVYSTKFPVDPFKRDNIFLESSNLSKELSSSNMQRKGFNIKNVQSLEKPQDYNVCNVIKTDYQTQ